MKNSLPGILLTLIWCGSFAAAYGAYEAIYALTQLQWLAVAISPLAFALSFVTIAGSLSLIGQRGIVPGTFPRDGMHPVYFLRRIYGLCWTQLYYFRPLYAALLSFPIFKRFAFWLYGYRGHADFIVYPDTWIRDLPLLSIRKGAYLSNRATLGTNLCLSDGTIFVGPVRIGEKAVVGHLSIIGTGSIIGDRSEVGIGAAIGLSVRLREGAKVGPTAGINHGCIIGENATVGPQTYVGLRSTIGAGVVIPGGLSIPAGSVINSLQDLKAIQAREAQELQAYAGELADLMGQLSQKSA